MAGKGEFIVGAGLGVGVTALIAALTSKPAQAAEAPPDQEVRQALATVLTLLGNESGRLDQISILLNQVVSSLGLTPEVLMTTEIQNIVFSRILLGGGVAGSAAKIYERAPYAGKIPVVKIHWPNGCNGLVDVAVYHGSTQFLPKNGFLSLNDATETYEVNEPILDQENIWVDIANRDAVNPHQPTIVVRIERQAGEIA